MTYSAVVLADSPVAYWRLGEDYGVSTADNAEGTAGLDGTYVGSVTWGTTGALAGDSNKACGFNSYGQWIEVPDHASLDLVTNFSLECWAYLHNDVKTRLIYRNVAGGYGLQVDDTQTIYFGAAGSSDDSKSSSTVTLNAWHHIVVTYGAAANSSKIYLDGADVTSYVGCAGSTFSANSAELQLGAYLDDFTFGAGGALDECAIYGTVLTAAKVLAHYNAGSGAASAGPITSVGGIASAEAFGATFVGPIPLAPGAKYVSPTGDDAAIGDLTHPWLTIGRFFATTPAPGATLYLRGGNYPARRGSRGNFTGYNTLLYIENVSGTAVQPITIAAYPGESPVITGTGGTYNIGFLFLYGSSHWIIDGISWQNMLPTQSGIICIGGDLDNVPSLAFCTDFTIRNCAFGFAAQPASYFGNGDHGVYCGEGSSYITITDNIFIGTHPTDAVTGAAIHCYAYGYTHHIYARRNIVRNFEEGLQLYDSALTGEFTHNTFLDCKTNIDATIHSAPFVLRDNAGESGTESNIYDPAGTATADHNYWGQSFDANYFLVPPTYAIGGASDGTDAGARNKTGSLSLLNLGIASAEAFGATTVALSGPQGLAVGGIASAEAFGQSAVTTVTPTGLPVVSVKIDFANDGAFNAAGDDVTAYALSNSVTWTRGRNVDFSGEATGSASFALSNHSQVFNKGGSCELKPGLPVLITASRLGAVYPLFFGYIERVAWDAIQQIATVTCHDQFQRLSEFANARVQMASGAGTVRDYRVSLLTQWAAGSNVNLCLNGRCKLDTGGWDATTYPGQTLTRITTDNPPGTSTTCAEWTFNPSSRLFVATPTGTLPGDTFTVSFYARTLSGNVSLSCGLSQDVGVTDWVPTLTFISSSWQRYVLRYTAVTGHDATPYLRLTFLAASSNTIRIGDVMVSRGNMDRPYTEGFGASNLLAPGTFPADVSLAGVAAPSWYGGGTVGPRGVDAPASYDISGGWFLYGATSLRVITTATMKSGIVISLKPYHLQLVAYLQYEFVLFLYSPSSAMPFEVGLAVKNGANWDVRYVTGTAQQGVGWPAVFSFWYPYDVVADSRPDMDVVVYVMQLDATARTFYMDGLKVLAPVAGGGSTGEPPQWGLATEADLLATGAVLSAADTLAGLSMLNDTVSSRHWASPTVASPYWRYVVQDRAGRAAASSAETFIDGDFSDFRGLDVDRAGIVNVVEYTYGLSVPVIYYAQDDASIASYGAHTKQISAGTNLLDTTTVPAAVSADVIAQHKAPLTRPQLVVQNRFPSQLQREVGDIITVTCSRLGITAVEYSIQTITTVLREQANLWETTYQLEESP